MATITIPKKIAEEVEKESQELGISGDDFLANAVLYYLHSLKGRLELKKELEAWEMTSDEDLVKFEKNI